MRRQRKIILSGVLLFLLGSAATVGAQKTPPVAIKEIEGLVLVNEIDPTIVIDLCYATENNFTGRKMYPLAVCALKKETAQKLANANADFKRDGFRIKIWDAYRPPSVQKIFWDLIHDERYVANPQNGSRHNRGGAVDITLVDDKGQEMEMPSDFDDFSLKASPENPHMSRAAKKNIKYLQSVMKNNGFLFYDKEWWHFDDSDWKNYPLVDVSFERFTAGLSDALVTWLIPNALQKLKSGVKQALVVEPPAQGSAAKLTTWEFKDNRWQAVFQPMDVVVGRNGFAPAGEKREGDGRTPSGIFHLSMAFGYDPELKTKLSYHQTTDKDFWVDDPGSSQYNQWVVGIPQANSYERLKRDDDLYKYAVVIEYNMNPVVPGQGSAIFLHVWRGADKPTTGCVAVAQADMVQLLGWLDRFENPVIVLGERENNEK